MSKREWVRKLAKDAGITQVAAAELLEFAQEQLDQDDEPYTDEDVFALALAWSAPSPGQ